MDGAVPREERCVFEYTYRDAGNFRTSGRLLLGGACGQAEEIVRSCLEWGNQFVAEQVGIPALCREHWESVDDGPSDLDHAFHEFVGLRPATNLDDDLRSWGHLDALLQRMRDEAGRWDVTLSPNCDL